MNIRRPVQRIKVYNWLDIIQKHVLPATCILCNSPGQEGQDICDTCLQHLPRVVLCCHQCAETLETPSSWPMLCGRCLSHPPAYDRTLAPFLYQGAIRHLITALKFGATYKNARLLGHLLSDYLHDSADKPDCIIPIPLHKSRYRERGFNQAIEIARVVSKELQIPLDVDSCIRHRDTPHQIALPAKQRRKNMKNAFSLRKPIIAQHVAIIDDVMTTGTTAHELAMVLKKAGVTRVDVWVCARA